MSREQRGEQLAEKLAEYPDVAITLNELKEAFVGIRLKGIRFKDGTEIGTPPEVESERSAASGN